MIRAIPSIKIWTIKYVFSLAKKHIPIRGGCLRFWCHALNFIIFSTFNLEIGLQFWFFINPEIVSQFYIFLFRKITICAVRRIQYSTEILSNSRSLECNAQLYVTLSLDTSPQLCWPVKFNSASFLSQPWCKLVPLFLML